MEVRNKKILGLINARGGSKGIPRKNIKNLAGKPLIAYTIDAGLGCTFIDDLVVSTDDEEIALIAKSCGAQVPFIRPLELAQDDVRQIDSVLHAIDYMENKHQIKYDWIVLLQPTSPFRTAEDINKAFELMAKEGAESVISFSPVENHHPYHMYSVEHGHPKPIIDFKRNNMQRQNLPNVYIVNGAIRISARDYVVGHKSFFSDNSCAYVMPRERSVNIDDPFDWEIAEFMVSRDGN